MKYLYTIVLALLLLIGCEETTSPSDTFAKDNLSGNWHAVSHFNENKIFHVQTLPDQLKLDTIVYSAKYTGSRVECKATTSTLPKDLEIQMFGRDSIYVKKYALNPVDGQIFISDEYGAWR